MPVQRPVPGVIRVVVGGTYGGINMANVFHIKCAISPPPFDNATVLAVATGVRTAYVNRFKSFMSTTAQVTNATGQDLSSITGEIAVVGGATNGTDAATAGPANVSLCLTWKINRHYRGGHPRTYLYGLTTNGPQGPNTFNSSIVSNAITAGNGFLTDIRALTASTVFTSLDLACVHRHYQNAELNPPVVSVIQTCTADNRIDSQRRRLGKDR